MTTQKKTYLGSSFAPAMLGLCLFPFLTQAEALEYELAATLASEATFWAQDTASASFSISSSTAYYVYGISINSSDTAVNFDDSFAEWHSGGWTLGLGAIDRHWSPSAYSSLILSDNARPVPSVYAAFDAEGGIDLPVIEYLGPLSIETFLGQLEADRPVPHTKLFGARLTIEPIEDLEVSFVRTAQWGGDGYDNSFDAFVKMLAGQEDIGDEPNQLAGYSVSYTFNSGLRTYFQAIGEDEASSLPTCYSRMAGLEGKTSIFGNPTLLTLEAVDTTIERTTSGFCGPNTAYNNGHYPGGYTHYGRVMGVPIDTESQSLTLYGHTSLPEANVAWLIGYADLNKENLATHRLTSTRTTGGFAELAITRSFGSADVTGSLRYQGFDLNNDYGSEGLSAAISISQTF